MRNFYRHWHKSGLTITAIVSTFALAALLLGTAYAVSPPSSVKSPLEVAETLDSLVQPRFQENAGRFGVDRVLVGGHDDVYDLAVKTRGERVLLRQVKNARHPFIIGFLHCSHKPGHDLTLPKSQQYDGHGSPFTEVLAAATKTDDGTTKLYDWGGDHLDQATLRFLPQLRRGQGATTDYGNWLVVMRPVLALQSSCLGCHAGAKRGDTLGVMVYAIDKNTVSTRLTSFQYGSL